MPRRAAFRGRRNSQSHARGRGRNRNRRNRRGQNWNRDTSNYPDPGQSTSNQDSRNGSRRGDRRDRGDRSEREPNSSRRDRASSVICGRFVKDGDHHRFHKQAYALLEHGERMKEKLAGYVQHVHEFTHLEEGQMDWEHECTVLSNGHGSSGSGGHGNEHANVCANLQVSTDQIQTLTRRIETLEACHASPNHAAVRTQALPNDHTSTDSNAAVCTQHQQQASFPHAGFATLPNDAGQLGTGADAGGQYYHPYGSQNNGNTGSMSRKRSLPQAPRGPLPPGTDPFQPAFPSSSVGSNSVVVNGITPHRATDTDKADGSDARSKPGVTAHGSGPVGHVGSIQNEQNPLYRDRVDPDAYRTYEM